MIGRAPFGATGQESSRVVFGAAALGNVSKSDADRTLDVEACRTVEEVLPGWAAGADLGDA